VGPTPEEDSTCLAIAKRLPSSSAQSQLSRDKGLRVDILEDQKGIALYAKYRSEKPDQDIEDCKGLAEVRRPRTS